jgi:hypothetical protein
VEGPWGAGGDRWRGPERRWKRRECSTSSNMLWSNTCHPRARACFTLCPPLPAPPPLQGPSRSNPAPPPLSICVASSLSPSSRAALLSSTITTGSAASALPTMLCSEPVGAQGWAEHEHFFHLHGAEHELLVRARSDKALVTSDGGRPSLLVQG